jgi:hypothetical protein
VILHTNESILLINVTFPCLLGWCGGDRGDMVVVMTELMICHRCKFMPNSHTPDEY